MISKIPRLESEYEYLACHVINVPQAGPQSDISFVPHLSCENFQIHGKN